MKKDYHINYLYLFIIYYNHYSLDIRAWFTQYDHQIQCIKNVKKILYDLVMAFLSTQVVHVTTRVKKWPLLMSQL